MFRHKIFFIVKYFQRNFQKKKNLKIFFYIWLVRKNYKQRKTEFSNHRRISENQIPTKLVGIQQSDTKIQGSSMVESSYQQTSIPVRSEFLQTCLQE